MVAVTDAAGGAGPTGARRTRWPVHLPRVPLEALLVAAASVLGAALVLQLWRADLSVPLRYGPIDDTKFYLMLVKGIVEHGWYATNAALGAPFGQRLSDYPQGADNLSLLFIRILALFSSDPALVTNAFFLLSFALTGATSHLVLRSLGLGAPTGAIASILFALLPYHFFRGESHLLLSAYYAVPLTAYLFLGLLAEMPILSPRPGPLRSRPWGRTAATVGACIVIGSANLYYATFAVAVLAGAVVVCLGARRSRLALRGLVLALLIAASVAANLAPTLVYRAGHGPNVALERSAAFTEKSGEGFPLRLAELVLPTPNSHLAALGRIAARYDNAIAPGYCESCYASLGAVGTVGFVWLVVCALGLLVGASGWFSRRRLLRDASVGVVIALFVGTVGGVSSLLEVFVTPDIRAWNRISLFIAFLSLLASAALLERLLARLPKGRRGSVMGGVAVTAVLGFGIYEQTSDSFVPSYGANARLWHSDSRFVEAIEHSLPHGAAVFQLPYVPFPEGYPETPVGDQVATFSTKYEALRGYLHSTTLRWSYGAVKGRSGDWPAQLAGRPLGYLLAAAAAAGFDGLWLDPAGFDPGRGRAIGAALARLLAVRPLISAAGDLLFFDMRPYLARLQQANASSELTLLRSRTLHPLSVSCRAGALLLENPSGSAAAVTLEVHVARARSVADTYRSLPLDGQASDVAPASSETVTRALTLPPGRSTIALTALAQPSRASAALLYATLADDALSRFETPTRVGSGALIAGLTGPPCTG